MTAQQIDDMMNDTTSFGEITYSIMYGNFTTEELDAIADLANTKALHESGEITTITLADVYKKLILKKYAHN